MTRFTRMTRAAVLLGAVAALGAGGDSARAAGHAPHLHTTPVDPAPAAHAGRGSASEAQPGATHDHGAAGGVAEAESEHVHDEAPSAVPRRTRELVLSGFVALNGLIVLAAAIVGLRASKPATRRRR